jgi:hypothetical protein
MQSDACLPLRQLQTWALLDFGPGLAAHKCSSLHPRLLLHPPGLVYSYRSTVLLDMHMHKLKLFNIKNENHF